MRARGRAVAARRRPNARAPIVLSTLEDGRIKLQLLDLGEVLDGPSELSGEGLVIGVGRLINCGRRKIGMRVSPGARNRYRECEI